MNSGKRLRLRPFTEEDAIYINEMRLEFAAQLAAGGSPYPMNIENHKEWISKMYPYGVLTNIYFAVEELETRNFVGYCSATNINYINRNAHVGFFLHKKARGKGFYKEVQTIFYQYLFNEINLRKIYTYILEYNKVSMNSMKKLGFEINGVLKEHVFQNGIYHNLYILSLMKEGFISVNKHV